MLLLKYPMNDDKSANVENSLEDRPLFLINYQSQSKHKYQIIFWNNCLYIYVTELCNRIEKMFVLILKLVRNISKINKLHLLSCIRRLLIS